ERGGTVGPELTTVAGTRDPKFIIESILDPSKVIASGYEAVLIITKAEQYVTGIVKREDAATVEVADSQGSVQKVAKSDIKQRAPQTTSLMPGNLKEILTVEEFHDVLAFVLSLR
ncbi:MAG: Triheme cytochrome c, partial [candidate division NC10 bacterium]